MAIPWAQYLLLIHAIVDNYATHKHPKVRPMRALSHPSVFLRSKSRHKDVTNGWD